MTFRGHMQNGVAVLDTPAGLPDGTPVRVEVERVESPFWQNLSVGDLVREQGLRPVVSVDELAGDWPEEDSVDDFLAFIREARR
jgi:hypothetical protein